jgi:hypothetical protein
MRNTRLAIYEMTRGTFPELVQLAEKSMLPRFAVTPGFVNYGLVDIGDHKIASISIWETHDQAEKSAGIAATWVKENVADRVRLVNNYVGELALFRGLPVAA